MITGAMLVNEWLPLLKNKRIGLVVNQTSIIGETHLVDSMLKLKVKVTAIFAPEHGFRGNSEAGAHIKSEKDKATGIPIISLYGKHQKPLPEDFKNVDVIVFDIQDVGVRCYTYISTLHYVMEACAENNKPLLLFDRPNPNGFYVDGPVLDMKFKSFVGMHPVPLVHGMTIGEYATMINGEGWLSNHEKCNLRVIKMKNYSHDTRYILPVRPSPNLPNIRSIYLYSGLVLFEGTSYSIGRGTDKPFECIGKPGLTHGDYEFTPKSIKGVAENPPCMNKLCRGYLLDDFVDNVFSKTPKLYISWLTGMYEKDTVKTSFFIPFFDNLAGTDRLRLQIVAGKNEKEITGSWENDLINFKKIRSVYLMYPEFTFVTIIKKN